MHIKVSFKKFDTQLFIMIYVFSQEYIVYIYSVFSFLYIFIYQDYAETDGNIKKTI